jgi:uncharacterized DUF497 family protein
MQPPQKAARLISAVMDRYGTITHIKSHINILTKIFSRRIYINMTKRTDFEWDTAKDLINQQKHGVTFALAQLAFLDHDRIILEDLEHSQNEKRYYCLGRVAGGILTVRFTYRKGKIRIIGAGYWRKGKKIYEKQNKVHG